MEGFYKCNKCKCNIQVYSTFANKYKRKRKIDIPFCPQCNNKNLKEISRKVFDNASYSLYLDISKKYKFRNAGIRKVEMGVKFK